MKTKEQLLEEKREHEIEKAIASAPDWDFETGIKEGLIFLTCIGANIYLMMNGRKPIEILWLGAGLAFLF